MPTYLVVLRNDW